MTKNETKRTYITFYKVMLILSTIGTSLSVFSLFGLPQAISEFPIAPIYSSMGIIINVITIVSIVALVLLWQKRIEGFYLKIGSYVAYIVATIIAIISAKPYIDYLVSKPLDPPLSQPEMEIFTSIVYPVMYAALAASIITTTIFMILWIKAWKKQQIADK